MNASTFTLPRFTLAVLTLLALAVKPYIPPKRLTVHPDSQAVASIYAPPGAVYGDDFAWTGVAGDDWRCRYDPTLAPLTCGWNLGWKAPDDDSCLSGGGYARCSAAAADDDEDGWGWENGRVCVALQPDGGPSSAHPQSRKPLPFPTPVATGCSSRGLTDESPPPIRDFSGYDGMNIQVHYEGKAKNLRLYMRNFNPVYADPADINTSKFMSAFLSTDDLKAGPVYVSLSEFSVGEWWVLLTLKQNTDQQLAMPEFDRILSLGIDHVEYGVHKMRVGHIELVGQRVPTGLYLTMILLVWTAFLCVELIRCVYRRNKVARLKSASAERHQDIAAQEIAVPKLEKTQAITDALTGAYNRAGVEQQIGAWYAAATFPPAFTVIMMEVDQFKVVRENLGPRIAERVLQALVSLVEANTRDQDILARWDDAVFVLLSRQTSKESLLQMTEKLRLKIAGCHFELAGVSAIRVRMGITIVRQGDTFNMALKRAEIALHHARSSDKHVVCE